MKKFKCPSCKQRKMDKKNNVCDVTLYKSPFSKKIKTKLSILKETGLCDQDRSAVNPLYIKALIDKVLHETRRNKYTLIISEIQGANKSIGIGAFAVLDNELDAFDRVTKDLLKSSSLLYLVCARECRGKAIIETAKSHVSKHGKRFMVLDALDTNYEYYVDQYGAFSIGSESSMKLSISLRKTKTKTVLSKLLYKESKNKGEYSMVIDVASDRKLTSPREVYEAFLERRLCGVLTEKGLPCKKKCLFLQPYCQTHAPKSQQALRNLS